MVNHKNNFIDPKRISVQDPVTGQMIDQVKVHTQNVERYNKEFKNYMRRF